MMTLAQRRAERLRQVAASGAILPSVPRKTTDGPGTFLRRALGTIGIHPMGEKCKCNERAALMDQKGPDWCEANVEEIIDWLEEEAKKRPLVGRLFNRAAAGYLVRRCIRQAREAARI